MTKTRLRHMAVMLLTGLSLSACQQRYDWVHPTKSLEQFGRDKWACEERASLLYPATPVTVQEGGGYVEQGFSQCRRSYSGFMHCYSPPPVYIPPSYSVRDMNAGPRKDVIESCLFSKGYQLIPAK